MFLSKIKDIWESATKSSSPYLHYASVDMSGAGYLPDSQKTPKYNSQRITNSFSRRTTLTAAIAVVFVVTLYHCSSRSNLDQIDKKIQMRIKNESHSNN